VLEGENATYPWYPASVTKLMTTYVTFKAARAAHYARYRVHYSNAAAQQPPKGFKVAPRSPSTTP
jgi:D-alanyl-D-alanine carboxypeptidase